MVVTNGDPAAAFRVRLQELYEYVRRPTYRSLEAHADRDGRTLRTSTLSDLLNGPGTPRWDTVQTVVRACTRHARSHHISVPEIRLDLDRWHAAYRAIENTPADLPAGAGRVSRSVRRRRAEAVSMRYSIPADL